MSILKLNATELKEIAQSFRSKVENGLNKANTEVLCIPTFITPNVTGITGTALVLDLGGTNYRVAVVDLSGKEPVIYPENGWKIDLTKMKTSGFTQEDLLKEMYNPVAEIKVTKDMPIGYCFSYPSESQTNGDANLVRWAKGVDIKEMVGQPVGKPVMDYFNSNKAATTKFTGVKVINDTIASLFAGLTQPGYDAYIGLIVGTGTNMATFIKADKIKKLDASLHISGLVPVNLESGNFIPPHLTAIDEYVDNNSDNQGFQRFEKAVSGMYLGEVLKAVFPSITFEEKFDAQKLTSMLSYPDIYREQYVDVARQIYERSAQLVAASLAGLIDILKSHDSTLQKVCLTAEGSMFWSKDRMGKDYVDMVSEQLYSLLAEIGHKDVTVDMVKMENANLTGTAIAALS